MVGEEPGPTVPCVVVERVHGEIASGLRRMRFAHSSGNHGRDQYVHCDVLTQRIESFWSMLKRGYVGTFHYMSEKHLQRYVNEFAARATMRELDTHDIMREIVVRSVGRRVTYAG